MIFSSNSVLRLARTAAVAAAFATLTGTAAGVLAAGAPAGSHVRQDERTVAASGDPDWNSTGSDCKVCTER
ncbi:hypothetical protein [Streptomyces sp. NPDC001194]|uniref:hypothetical protein n=1 Tax=Streptomyces sp. NPDC001194 TaxID=3364547 RepID=UPI00367DA6EE